MRSKSNYGYGRHMRSTQERRANCDPEVRQYVRGRRTPCNLPNTYDDIPTVETRNWKDHRKTQYHTDGRGEKHQIVFDSEKKWGVVWDLEKYLKDHNIPNNVEHLYRYDVEFRYGYWKCSPPAQWWLPENDKEEIRFRKLPRDPNGPNKQKTRYEPYRHYPYIWERRNVKVWMPYDEPFEYRTKVHLGYRVTWWSNKDVGMEHILRRIQY